MKTITNKEFYSGFEDLPKPKYPFPDYIHPQFKQQREEYYQWIDTEYVIHSKEAREKHKKHHLTDIAARGCPFLKSIDELRPLSNYTANGAMMDDYFDKCSRREMYDITQRIISILNGELRDEPEENGIFHLYWVLRQDALKINIPKNIYDRFVRSIRYVFEGYSEEKIYYRSNTIPPLAVYLLIREATSGVLPYCDYAALQKDYREIPDYIFEHPHLKRIYTLCGLMIGIHNDIISLPKELHREEDTMNLVKVIQNEKNIPMKDDYMEAIKLHDEYLHEFLILQKHLPPFDGFHDLVANYVKDLGIMISGVYAWHTNDTSRYVNGGFVEGEYVSNINQ